jgi:hypothetical protein
MRERDGRLRRASFWCRTSFLATIWGRSKSCARSPSIAQHKTPEVYLIIKAMRSFVASSCFVLGFSCSPFRTRACAHWKRHPANMPMGVWLLVHGPFSEKPINEVQACDGTYRGHDEVTFILAIFVIHYNHLFIETGMRCARVRVCACVRACVRAHKYPAYARYANERHVTGHPIFLLFQTFLE